MDNIGTIGNEKELLVISVECILSNYGGVGTNEGEKNYETGISIGGWFQNIKVENERRV